MLIWFGPLAEGREYCKLQSKILSMKWKYAFAFVLGALIFACNNDDDNKVDFDPVAQALIDDELLVEFLQTHYLTEEKTIDTILNNETSLYSLVDVENVDFNSIDYKLYYYIDQNGIGPSPTINDSVHVTYKGFLLDSTQFDQNLSYTSGKSWFHLPGTITGFRHGAKQFRSGERVIYPDESFGYENAGNGIFFMPSGLAYGSIGSGGVPVNAPIYYFFELGRVVEADGDNDLIKNNDEDINGDGDVIGDDTDDDGISNYADADDDNDGILTRDEDSNGDGDPRNDDDDNDGIPNYLDKDS